MIAEIKDDFPLISIVTVNFNQPEITAALLLSLQKITWPCIEIFVVDNGCQRGCLHLKDEFPEVKFLVSNTNLGFAGGNNLALRQAKGKYILLLNNDTEVAPDFLEPMAALFKTVPKLGIVSPLIIYEEGKLIQYAGAKAINLFTGRGRKVGNKQPVSPGYEKAYPTELGHGAAMMFPRHLLKELGYLPEEYFLYYEEHDWTEAAKRAGYKVYFQGASKVYHKESVSVGKANPLKTYYMNRNRLLFIQRNAGGFEKLSAQLFYLFLAFPKSMIRHAIAGEGDHIKALLRVLKWHLTRIISPLKPHPSVTTLNTSRHEPFKG